MAISVRALIERAVRTAFEPTSIQSIEIEEGQDHTGEDALFVAVTFPPTTPLVGGKKYLAAATGVSNTLLKIGDQRFPYLRLNYAGEEVAEESDRSKAASP